MKSRCVAMVLLGCGLAAGQAGPSGAQRIAGRVVHDLSGAGLARVRLSLLLSGTDTPIVTVISSADGAFLFPSVTEGNYILRAERNGFSGQNFQQKSLYHRYTTGVIVSRGKPVENQLFRLIPGAAISGFVRDMNGDPVPWATVRVIRLLGNEAARGAQIARSVYAKDDGSYRVHGLPAGRYVIAASGIPWYQTIETPESTALAYPLTYHPSATNPELAAQVPLEPGGEATADVLMEAKPAGRLKILYPTDAKQSERPARAMLALLGPAGLRIPAEQARIGFSGGSADAGTVAAGSYLVGVISDQNLMLAEKQVTFNGQSQEMALAPGEMGTISGQAHWTETARQGVGPLLAYVVRPTEGGGIARPIGADGRFEIPGIPEGRYRFGLNARKPVSIESIRVEGANYSEGWITVAPKANVKIDVTLDSRAVDVEGIVEWGGQPMPGVMVVLLPKEQWKEQHRLRMDQSNSDGSFRWQGVSPGEYLAFAFLHEMDWALLEPADLERWLPQGQLITVGREGPKGLRIGITPMEAPAAAGTARP